MRAGRTGPRDRRALRLPAHRRQKTADHAAGNSDVKKRRHSERRCVRLGVFELPDPVAELAATDRVVRSVADCVKSTNMSLARRWTSIAERRSFERWSRADCVSRLKVAYLPSLAGLQSMALLGQVPVRHLRDLSLSRHCGLRRRRNSVRLHIVPSCLCNAPEKSPDGTHKEPYAKQAGT